MNRQEIRERVETALQDEENRHWSDREINRFIDDALIEFTRIAKHPQVEGDATNPGGTTSLGEATKTGTLSVDGKTATVEGIVQVGPILNTDTDESLTEFPKLTL